MSCSSPTGYLGILREIKMARIKWESDMQRMTEGGTPKIIFQGNRDHIGKEDQGECGWTVSRRTFVVVL